MENDLVEGATEPGRTLPHVGERIKAAVTDSFVLVALMVLTATIFSGFRTVPDEARIAAFVFIVFLYDPIFTSSFGGTIGHMMFKIRVKRKNNIKKNILLPHAIVRYLVKTFLGLISLLTVASNKDRLAIHDMVVGSIVVFKDKN